MHVKSKEPMNKTRTTPSAALKPRKLPQQERSKQTIERILQGTQSVMREKGVRAVTTPAIAEASGVNVASIYQYFPNKESIIQALYEQKLTSIRNKVGDLLDDLNGPDWKKGAYQIVCQIKLHEREVGFDRTIVEASQYYELLDGTWRSHADTVAHSISRAIRRLGSTWSDKAIRDVSFYVFSLSMATWDFWRLRKSEPDIGLHQQAVATVALMALAIESESEIALPAITSGPQAPARQSTRKKSSPR